jgi:hypothetical protein
VTEPNEQEAMMTTGREVPLQALLRSWKRAHRRMQERNDPEAEKLARDIDALEHGPTVPPPRRRDTSS